MNFSLSLSVSFLSSLIHSASLIIFLILRFVCSWHTDVKVSIDGTWLTRRGHSSLHGIATVCSTADPPKVLDFECLSRHCTTCSGLLGIREYDPEMYQRLLAEHIESGCEENHGGSSSGMEAACLRKIC